MKQILFESWNPKSNKGQAVRSNFQPFCFSDQSSRMIDHELYEVHRVLTFNVLTRLSYGDKNFDRIQENADRQLLSLVAKPFVEQAHVVMSCIYARDHEASMIEMSKLMDLLTKGQVALDEQAQ